MPASPLSWCLRHWQRSPGIMSDPGVYIVDRNMEDHAHKLPVQLPVKFSIEKICLFTWLSFINTRSKNWENGCLNWRLVWQDSWWSRVWGNRKWGESILKLRSQGLKHVQEEKVFQEVVMENESREELSDWRTLCTEILVANKWLRDVMH